MVVVAVAAEEEEERAGFETEAAATARVGTEAATTEVVTTVAVQVGTTAAVTAVAEAEEWRAAGCSVRADSQVATHMCQKPTPPPQSPTPSHLHPFGSPTAPQWRGTQSKLQGRDRMAA